MGVAPQLQPLEGMLLRRSTDIYPKELARDMRQFFNSLLRASPPPADSLLSLQPRRPHRREPSVVAAASPPSVALFF